MRWVFVASGTTLLLMAIAALVVFVVVKPLERNNETTAANDDRASTLNDVTTTTAFPTTAPTTTTTTLSTTLSPSSPPTALRASATPTRQTKTLAPTTSSSTTTTTITLRPTNHLSDRPTNVPTTRTPTATPTLYPTTQQEQQQPTSAPITNLRQYLRDQINSGASRIVVPPGTYRLEPVNRVHLVLWDLMNVEIVMSNVDLVCTQSTRALTIGASRNVSIVGPVTIDYDPLPYTQGRIVNLSNDRTVHDIVLDDGYPPASQVVTSSFSKYEIFRADTRTLRYGSYYDYTVETFGNDNPRQLRIVRGNANDYHGEQVGDLIVINAQHAPDGSIPHAIVIEDSSQILLQHVTLYASNSFGFLETNCAANQYVNCRVQRRQQESKIFRQPRLRSLNADAFHSKYATVGPLYENCVAEFMGDDALNVNGDYHMVMSVTQQQQQQQQNDDDGNNNVVVLRVLAKVGGFNIQAGDPLELLDYRGRRLPNVAVIDVTTEPVDSITTEEREFVSQQRLHAAYKRDMSEIHNVTIIQNTNDIVINDETLPRGSLVGADNRMGNGVRVTGCVFGNTRSRGILIKASQATIVNNVLQGVTMEAIKVASEYWWLEAGSSNNVLIDGNVIRDSDEGEGIAVYAYTGQGYGTEIAPAGAHHDIVIQNNVIENTVAGRHIWVTSINGLRLFNNTYGGPDKLVMEQCENVQQV